MTVIRLNQCPQSGRANLHGSGQNPTQALRKAAQPGEPVVIMIHGYKYDPASPAHCPQTRIFAADHAGGWPVSLGLVTSGAVGITFGWPARGPLHRAFAAASRAGAELARIIGQIHRQAPQNPVHLIAHSLGAEVALTALALAPKGAIGRIILLTGASFQSHAEAALQSPAGRTAEIINVVSRENDLFDCLFEWLIPAPAPLRKVLGQGIDAVNALTLQLDCPKTLAGLARFGSIIAPSQTRICRWSGYTRSGAMAFYAKCLLDPHSLPLAHLRAHLPATCAPRWARLSLGSALKTRITLRAQKIAFAKHYGRAN